MCMAREQWQVSWAWTWSGGSCRLADQVFSLVGSFWRGVEIVRDTVETAEKLVNPDSLTS